MNLLQPRYPIGLHSFRIIAVHGLCGDSESTWDSGESWLKETLPAYLAHARVSTYSYELSEEGVSALEIDQKAKELLDHVCNGKLADTVSKLPADTLTYRIIHKKKVY